MKEGAIHGVEDKERIAGERRFELQTPREFRDDFVEEMKTAPQIGLETMQLEVCEETAPIFEGMIAAHERGARVGMFYDRVARQHVRVAGGEGWMNAGIRVATGDKKAVHAAFDEREEMIARMERLGIVYPRMSVKDRLSAGYALQTVMWGEPPKSNDDRRGSHHDHIKLAVSNRAAWLKTMNLRAEDFEISNVALKITDPLWVADLHEVFTMRENQRLTEDRVFAHEEDPDNQILFDAGVKGQSVIYDRAVEMVGSLKRGDEFTYIGQWPPVKMLFGELSEQFDAAAAREARGTFLVNSRDTLHSLSRRASHAIQWGLNHKYGSNPNITVENLPRDTHVKALLIKRATGEMETMIGSHNMSSWTVGHGTRELSVWSQDPEVTGQVDDYVISLRNEIGYVRL